MKPFISILRNWILPFLAWILFKIFSWTWKIEIIEPDLLKSALKDRSPLIFAHWHGDEIPLLYLISPYRIATIVSQSNDGEMMNRLVILLGGKTARGSSTRGGVQALKGLIRLCHRGANISFAVDGPKGPIYQVKPGIFEVSRVAQFPIYVGGVYCDRAWKFHRSWNQAYLPKPFAHLRIVWKGPYGPIGKDENPKQTSLKHSLEQALHEVHHLANPGSTSRITT